MLWHGMLYIKQYDFVNEQVAKCYHHLTTTCCLRAGMIILKICWQYFENLMPALYIIDTTMVGDLDQCWKWHKQRSRLTRDMFYISSRCFFFSFILLPLEIATFEGKLIHSYVYTFNSLEKHHRYHCHQHWCYMGSVSYRTSNPECTYISYIERHVYIRYAIYCGKCRSKYNIFDVLVVSI